MNLKVLLPFSVDIRIMYIPGFNVEISTLNDRPDGIVGVDMLTPDTVNIFAEVISTGDVIDIVDRSGATDNEISSMLSEAMFSTPLCSLSVNIALAGCICDNWLLSVIMKGATR